MKPRHIVFLSAFLCFSTLAIFGCSDNQPGAVQTSGTDNPSHGQPTVSGQYGSANVIGKINYSGELPKIELVQQTQDCAEAHGNRPIIDESLIVNSNKTVKNVFVYIEGVKGIYAPSDSPLVLDQKGCMYSPRVFGVITGQKLTVKNSDEKIFHNVQTIVNANKRVNKASLFGQDFEYVFDKPEVMVTFKCDVHSWMRSYAGVLNHPFFAVTGDDGSFKIGRLPAGTYKLKTWHEKLGVMETEFTVGEKETKTVDLTYKGKS